jgi:hypothetical protein
MIATVVVAVLSVAAGEFPRVVRLPEVTCVQFLGDEGTVREACRASDSDYSGRDREVSASDSYRREDFPPAPLRTRALRHARLVADLGFELLIGGGPGGVSSAGFGIAGAVGVRLPSGLGVMGVVDAQVLTGRAVVTLAPALRFGDATSFRFAVGPSVVINFEGDVALAGTLLLRAVMANEEGFSHQYHLGASVIAARTAPGLLLVFGAGLGGAKY